jgi:hypothetical protein
MLREPKVCRPLGLLCTCLCFSVLCEGRLLAQFVTVIDGYDVSLYDRTSPALSFSPFAENHWQLHYTSGRYLREIDPKIEVIARTFVNAASATSSRSLLFISPRLFALPVLHIMPEQKSRCNFALSWTKPGRICPHHLCKFLILT